MFFYTRAYTGTRALAVLLIAASLMSLGANLLTPSRTAAATNSTINFQARLQTSTGNIVNDGNYNVQFKLYDVSSGGTALWTETYQNSASQGVQVINGYLSVSLGSITAFPTINWDQNLYLTMNIGGTSTGGSPTYDGEMNPRLSVTALPYAFRAGQLAKLTGANTSVLDWATQTAANTILLPNEGGTLCIQASANCGFLTGTTGIQNTTTTQTNASFNIQSAADANITGVLKARASQTADLLQIQDSAGAELFSVRSNGALRWGGDSTTDLVRSTTGVLGFASLTRLEIGGNIALKANTSQIELGGNRTTTIAYNGSANNGGVTVQADSGSGIPLTVKGKSSQTADLLQVQNSSGTVFAKLDASGVLGGANGSGANVAGSALTIAGGQGTGTGNGGNLNFQVAKPAGSSGSSLNALSTVFSLSGVNGSALFQNATNSATAFQIQNVAGTGNLFIADTANTKVGIATAPSSGGATLQVGGNVAAVVSSSTALSIQNSAGSNSLVFDSATGSFNLLANAQITTRISNTAGYDFSVQRARGSFGSLSAVTNGDELGAYTFRGWNGSSYQAGALIGAYVDSTVTGSTVPSSLVFSTSNSSAFPTERMRIRSDGSIGINTGSIFTSVANGASAIGFKLDTPSYTTVGAKLLSVQNNAVEKFSIDKDGNVSVPSGSSYRINGVQLASTDLGDTSNLAYLNAGTSGSPQIFTGNNVVRVSGTDAFQIQRTNGANTMFRADTTNGRVAINLASTAPAYTLDVGGDVNISSGSVFRINGTDINTAGTLNNVAYLNQANTFSAAQTVNAGSGTGNSLRVTTSGNPASGNAVIFASNTNASPSGNLLDLRAGSTPASKFSVAADGSVTSVGSWTQNSAGNAVATLNWAGNTNNGQIVLQEGGSTRGSLQYYGSNQNASGITNSSLALQNDNGPLIFRQNNTTTFSVANADGAATFTGIQPASGAGNGTTPNAALTVDGAKGGNTSGTTGQTGGTGASIVLNAGSGGNAASGSTNGSGGNITLSAGAAGIGGTGGSAGSVIVKNAANSTTAFQVQTAAGAALLTADTTNGKVNVLGTLTVGVAGTTNGTITLANSTNSNLAVLQIGAPTGSGNATYTVPAIAGGGSDTFCMLTLGNCGASLSVSGGQNNYVARFTGASSFSIGKLYDDTNFVGVNTTTDSGQLSIISRAAAEPGLFVQAAASATSPVAIFKGGATPGSGANLLELQNAGSSTALAYFDASGNLNAPFGTFTGGALLQSDLIVNTIATIKGANSLTLGETGTATGSILFKGSTAASGTIKLIGPSNPTGGTLTLTIPTITANDTLCTNGLICSNYAPAAGANYLGKNTNDTSTSSFNGTLLALSNTNTATSSVLSLSGAGTNSTLSVTNSANPTSGQALISVNNSNAGASGNLIDLKNNGSSVFSVNAAGNAGVGGTLGVTGDLAVNTSKFTVQASTGNALVAGTLGVTGSVTASGGLTVAANQSLSMAAGTGTFIQNYQTGAAAGNLGGTFSAHAVNATNYNNAGSTATLNGITVAMTGTATSGGANTNNAVNLANVVAAANNTFNALFVGTGYGSILNYGGTALINGNGLLQNAALDSTLTYTNLQKVGALSAGSITTGFGTISTGNNITTTATVQGGTVQGGTGVFTGAGALTLGTTGTSTGAIVFKGSTAASGTITLQGPSNPSTNNYTLNIPALTANAEVCTDQLNCTTYAPATGGNYIAKNSNDSSSAGFAGVLLSLSNTSTGASAGVLSLSNAGTNNALSITASSNPAAGNALLYINNSNASASGNLVDLRNNGTSKLTVDANGNLVVTGVINANSGISTSAGNLSITAAGTDVAFNSKNLTGVGTIGSGAITSSSTVTGTTLNGTTGINTGASAGTQRIDSSGNLVNIGNFTSTGATVFTATGANGFSFKPGTDNATAFSIQKADGTTSLFVVDSGNSKIGIGVAPASGGATLQVAGSASLTGGNLTLDNGQFYQAKRNTSGTVINLIGFVAGTDTVKLQSGSTSSTSAFVFADGSGNSLATINGVGATTFQNTNDSSTAFQILQSTVGGGATLFKADTTGSGSLTLGVATAASSTLTVSGSLLANGGVTTTSGTALSLDTGGNNTINLGNSNAGTINIGTNNAAHTFHIGDGGTSTAQAITIGSTGSTSSLTLQAAGTIAANATGLQFSSGGSRTINVTQPASGAGNSLTVAAGSGSASGNGAGGNLTLQAGAGGGTGASGAVIVKAQDASNTAAFQIQNSSATVLFAADTSGNMLLKVGTGTSNLTVSGNGDLYVTGGFGAGGMVLIGTSANGVSFDATTHEFTLSGTARHATTVMLAPEYAGAVLTGDGGGDNVGTMTSDFCSNTAAISLNTGVCATSGDAHNYYSWTTTQGSAQDYDIYIRYHVPSNFGAFAASNPITMFGWVTNATSNSDTVQLALYKGATACSTGTHMATTSGQWTSTALGNFSGGNFGSCTIAAGDTVIFKVTVKVGTSGNFARAGEITFNYLSRY